MKKNAGFTMVEVIVIIAVIAILGGILTPMVIKEIGKSKVTRAGADMEAISMAFTQYYSDTGFWPENYNGRNNRRVTLRNFGCFYDNTQTHAGWDGPYLKNGVDDAGSRVAAVRNGGVWEGVIDPWGSPFRVIYRRPGDAGVGGGIAVLSAGPNGRFDTTDADAVIGTASQDDIVEVITARVGQ